MKLKRKKCLFMCFKSYILMVAIAIFLLTIKSAVHSDGCGGVFHNSSRWSCCEGQTVFSSMCCNGKLLPHDRSQICCNGQTVPASFGQVCCDGKVVDFDECCGGKILSSNEQCCGGQVISSNEQCCGGYVIPEHWYCCLRDEGSYYSSFEPCPFPRSLGKKTSSQTSKPQPLSPDEHPHKTVQSVTPGKKITRE